jgi:hypothetical protein
MDDLGEAHLIGIDQQTCWRICRKLNPDTSGCSLLAECLDHAINSLDDVNSSEIHRKLAGINSRQI